MLSKAIVSEDTRAVLYDEFAEAYADRKNPMFGVAVYIYNLLAALEVAEYEADEQQASIKWTSDTPTESGFYWQRCNQGKLDIVTDMVLVIVIVPEAAPIFHYSFNGKLGFHACDMCQWAGPIPMPKEPNE